MQNKYLLKVGNTEYTIPKENLKVLAMLKASDLEYNKIITNTDEAIEFFNSIGVNVIEV